MTITKIIEGTLIAGQSTITFTDSDIPNSILRVYPADSELIYESITLSGTSLIVTYPVQSVNKAIALYIVKDGTIINDTLISTSTSEALSANMGKSLKDSIDTVSGNLATLSDTVAGLIIPDEITDLSDVNVTSIQDGQVLAWDEDTSKFVNVDQSAGGYPFINMSSKIYGSGNITSNFSSFSYTATQDSFMIATIKSGNMGTSALVYLNGEYIAGNSNTQTIVYTPVLIKIGDVITVRDVSGSLYAVDVYAIR